MEIVVTARKDPLPELQPVEMVERKGLGHPDTLCDALAEEVSVALCRFYLERFGVILHHNVDKVLLVGGQSRPAFGGGEVTAPIEIYLAGRATFEAGGVRVPVEELALESCKQWLRAHLRHLDPDRHVKLFCRVRPGSTDLVELFLRRQVAGEPLANDTSCGAGFAPLTPLEATVLRTERGLRSPEALRAHPERGEDLKVMAVRRGERVGLTVSDAFVSAHIASLRQYAGAREALREDARVLGAGAEVEVNAADDLAREQIYWTVTGTSAEAGDDGEAGRGNRANGLITPYRPMTMESVAGKNPVSHVGKLYNVAASLIAEQLVQRVGGLRGAECYLVSRVGAPVRMPQLVHVRCWLAGGCAVHDVEPEVDTIVAERLSVLDRMYEDFVAQRVLVV